MVEFTKLDLVVLLFNLIIVVLCWIAIINNYENLRKLKNKINSNNQTIKNSFAIGIGSGLVVFLLSLFAEKISFYPANFNSLIDFIYSLFIGVINLLFQISIIIALISWVILFTFKSLIK